MTPADHSTWSFATAREPSRFAAAVHPQSADVEHALGQGETLCGIAGHEVEVYRHLFRPDRSSACTVCGERSAAAPTRPSGQERLHNRVLSAVPGRIRDELISALTQGAKISLWIEGPARKLTRDYADSVTVTEGGPAGIAALQRDERIGLAKVEHQRRQYVILLPHNGPPVIAYGRVD